MGNNTINTHHIVPVSCGGSDEGCNKKEVNKEKHNLYHKLYNNLHPSAVIRVVLSEFIPFYFSQINIEIEKEPFKSYLIKVDKLMNSRLDKDTTARHKEKQESIRAIEINLDKKKKAEKIKSLLKELLDIHDQEWLPEVLFLRLTENWLFKGSEGALISENRAIAEYIKTLREHK